MKIRKRRREISMLLIIIMLFSGLCFDVSKAKASFLHTDFQENQVSINVTKAVLHNQDLCIQETISERMTNGMFRQESRSNSRVNSRANSKARMVFALLENLPGTLGYITEITSVTAVCNTTQSSIAIIDYIHHQDGEKHNI